MVRAPIMRRVLLNPVSVGGWIVEWLRDPAKMTLAIDYLEIVNRESAAVKHATGVAEAIAGVDNFLPTMLKLPSHLMERAATLRIVVDLLTNKVMLFQGPWVLAFVMLDFWSETLKNNPMGNDENQDAWDGRVRHFETRLNEVIACTERTDRRMSEQVRENSAATAAQISQLRTETRQQIAELRTETTQTRQQVAELSSGMTQMRGQMDEIVAVLRGIAAQRA